MRQKVEIEVDVPDGWELTGEYRLPKIDEPHLTASGVVLAPCTYMEAMGLILRKVEPKRESRWMPLTTLAGGYDNVGSCRYYYPNSQLCRIDYEDGKLVAVTLEPEGEP